MIFSVKMSTTMTTEGSTSAQEFQGIQPKEFFRQHVERGLRTDGRNSLTSLRDVAISQGTITTADASAVVKQGATTVVCGVKLELAPPTAADPDKGFIVPNVDFPPICHSQFKPGPPSDAAQTSSQFINEVILNSKVIDPSDLVIVPGKLAWVVNLDLVCLNHDGGVLDVALKAMVAALRNLKLPKVNVTEPSEDDEVEEEVKISVDLEGERSPLKLKSQPLGVSLALFEDKILVDPTSEEEKMADGLVTVVLDADTNDLVHFHKPGGAGLARERLTEVTTLAKKQVKAVKKLIEKASPVKY